MSDRWAARPSGKNARMRYVGEVQGPQGSFFVRAEPWNYLAPGGIGLVERMVEHDHSWVIHVRSYHDDPFGPIVYEERVSKDAVWSAIERVEQEIRSGTLLHPVADSTPPLPTGRRAGRVTRLSGEVGLGGMCRVTRGDRSWESAVGPLRRPHYVAEIGSEI
jgi:hypothetical protein